MDSARTAAEPFLWLLLLQGLGPPEVWQIHWWKSEKQREVDNKHIFVWFKRRLEIQQKNLLSDRDVDVWFFVLKSILNVEKITEISAPRSLNLHESPEFLDSCGCISWWGCTMPGSSCIPSSGSEPWTNPRFVEWSTRQSIFGVLTCNSWNLQFYILFCAISSRESCLIRFYSLPLHIPTSLLITFSCPEGEMIKTPQNLRPQKVFCHKKPFRADDKPTGTVASRLYNPVAGRVLETRWLMRLGSPDLLFNRWDAG